MEAKKRIIAKGGVVVSLLLIAFVIRNWLVGLLGKLYPMTSAVANESWLVQLSLVGVIAVIYGLQWKGFTAPNNRPRQRILLIVALLLFFFLFRFDNRIHFYHVPRCAISYIGICFIAVFLFELAVLVYRKCYAKRSTIEFQTGARQFYYDAPAKVDSLKRNNHAKVLVDQIGATLSKKDMETSFSILLNEQYGAGKSSFFNMIESNAERIGLKYCFFRPWLSDSPSSMMQDFLSLLEDKLSLDDPAISRLVREYSGMLTGVRTHDVIVTFNTKDRNKSLTKKHDGLLDEMRKLRCPILVLIDDVDRLDSHELLTLLKIIRNTADFPYLCYVLAADKESICQNLSDLGIIDTDLYLRKFFNLEISFPPDDNGIRTILIDRLMSLLKDYSVNSNVVASHIETLLSVESIWDVFYTPRDVYRFINLYSYSLEILRQTKLIDDINMPDLMLLSLIQFISPEWYKALRDRNDKLLNYNTTRGRFFFNKDKVKAFYTRSVIEVQKQVLERNNYKTKSQEDHDNTTGSLETILQSIKADPFNALKDIVYKLFGSETDVRDTDRICYKNEYFKYFAGHYRINEVSTAEAFSVLGLSLEEYSSYLSEMTDVQIEPFLHKMLMYVEERQYHNRIDVLIKLLKLAEKHFSLTKASISSLFHNSMEEQVVFGLFVSNTPSDSPLPNNLKEEKDALLQLYTNDNRFQLLSLVLKSIKKQMGQFHFVYGDQLAVEIQEFLINRFIDEKLRISPFSKETISIIPYMREMYPVFWDEAFSQCVRSSSEPMEYIYNLITVSETTRQIVWNQEYINALDDNGAIPGLKLFAQKLVGDIIEPEIAADMDTLDVGRSSKLDEELHPFIKAAMNWHRSRKRTGN